MLAYRRAATRVRETRRLDRRARARRRGEGAARDRQDDRGEDRRDRRDRGDRGAHEAEGTRPAGGRRVPAPPRTRPEDGGAHLARARRDDARGAAGGGRVGAAADALGAGRPKRGEDPEGAGRGSRSRGARRGRCSGPACRPCSRSSPSCARIRLRSRSRRPAASRRRKETFRDLDVIATATDPAALIEAFTRLPLGRGGRRPRRHEGDGDLPRRPPLRPARRPAGVLRQPAAALHRLEGAQRRHARGGRSAAGSRSPSTASRPSRRARSSPPAPRRSCTRYLGYAFIPPELRENAGELEAARAAALPALVELGDLRGDLHTHTHVVGREGDDRGDGRGGASARLRLPRDVRPLATPARRTAAGSVGGDRRAERAVEALPAPEGRRGEHPRRRLARRRRRGARRSSTG